MRLPVLQGVIDRRILINYRVDPEIVQRLLPSHLVPLVVNGSASAGICLLRLRDMGLKYLPSTLRISSENSAHRFLVKYKDGGENTSCVYIPRRDTDSKLNVLLTGKFLSWPHFPAVFETEQSDDHYRVIMNSLDGTTHVLIDALKADEFPRHSMFDSLHHASSCFQECATGISPHDGRPGLNRLN